MLSLGIPDSQIALGIYKPELLTFIKKQGGKFGVVEYIAQDKVLVGKLQKLGVSVGDVTPIILGPGEEINDDFFTQIDRAIGQIPDSIKPYMNQDNSFHVRGGSPGDFMGLVDVIKTPVITQATLDRIRKAISHVRGSAHGNSTEIAKYAEGEGVFWDPTNLQIGVVPSLRVPIVTVTEDPNNDGRLFIDTEFPNGNGDRVMSSGDYTTSDGEINDIHIGNNPQSGMVSELEAAIISLNEAAAELSGVRKRNIPDGSNIYRAIHLLKITGILDPNMTYQFELGWLRGEPDRFILLQVKEFAKKNPVKTRELIKTVNNSHQFQGLTYGLVSRIITGLTEGEVHQTPILDGQYRWNIWGDLQNTSNGDFTMRPRENSDDLQPNDYHENLRGFIHGDAHGGTLAHNSFRFAQSVVRKGGTIILGSYDPTARKNPEKKSLQLQVKDGKLEAVGMKDIESDNPYEIMKQLTALIEGNPGKLRLPKRNDIK